MKLEEFEKLNKYEKEELLGLATAAYWARRAVIGTCAVVVLCLGGCPYYNVWQQELSGKAVLAEAQYSRQASVETAKAKKESASFEAESEVIRANGVKQANTIIADGLGGPDGYLTYLKIQALADDSCQKIYVPTEAALPILEAAGK